MIVTFYSYKGGVGRTQALANVAVCLANQGKDVILVDFDLESPGLHHYFRAKTSSKGPYRDGDLNGTDGLLEYLSACAKLPTDEPDCRKLLMNCYHPNLLGGSVRLLPAGRLDKTYGERLAAFSWGKFYSESYGAEFLELMKAQLTNAGADVVLIDSRTGMTDVGLICTFQLPDILVLLFALHQQGIEGAQRVLQSIEGRGSEDDANVKRPSYVLAVPARVDETGEIETLQKWMARVRSQLGAGEGTQNKVILLDQIGERIPYLPQAAFGEQVVVTQGSDQTILSTAYSNLSSALLSLEQDQPLNRTSAYTLRDSPPSLTLLQVQRQEVKSLLDRVRSGCKQLRDTAAAEDELSSLLYQAEMLRRDLGHLAQEMEALTRGTLLLGKRFGIEAESALEQATGSPYSLGTVTLRMEALAHQLEEIERTRKARGEEVEQRLLKAAAGARSLVDEALSSLIARMDSGQLEGLDSKLLEAEEQLRERSLLHRLSENKLSFGMLCERLDSPDDRRRWLDERLKELLDGALVGEEDEKPPLRNLLRLQLEELPVPERLHWDAYDALCLMVSDSEDELLQIFAEIGRILWTRDWRSMLADPLSVSTFQPASGIEARKQLRRISEANRQLLHSIVQCISLSLGSHLVDVQEQAPEWLSPLFRERNDDPSLLQAVQELASNKDTSLALRRSVTALWMHEGWQRDQASALQLLPEFLRVSLELEETSEALLTVLAADAMAEESSDGGARNGVWQCASQWVPKIVVGRWPEDMAGQRKLLESMWALELRSMLWQTPAGRGWLVALAGELCFPQHQEAAARIRPWLLYEAEGWESTHLWSELRRWLESLQQHQRPMIEILKSVALTGRVRKLLEPTLYSSWESSAHYGRFFRDTFEPKLTALLAKGPKQSSIGLMEELSKLTLKAFISNAQRTLRHSGARVRAPEGSAKSKLGHALTQMKEALGALIERQQAIPGTLQGELDIERDWSRLRSELVDYLKNEVGYSCASVATWVLESCSEKPIVGLSLEPESSRDVSTGKDRAQEKLGDGGGPLSKDQALKNLGDDLSLDPLLVRFPKRYDIALLRRWFLDLLGYRSGQRTFATVTEEYLERGGISEAIRCLLRMDGGEHQHELERQIRAAWGLRQEQWTQTIGRLHDGAQELISEPSESTPKSLKQLEEFLADAQQKLKQCPPATASLQELAEMSNTGLMDIQEAIQLLKLAFDEASDEIQAQQDAKLNRLRSLKAEADKIEDAILFSPEVSNHVLSLITRLSELVRASVPIQDINQLESILDHMRQLKSERDAAIPDVSQFVAQQGSHPVKEQEPLQRHSDAALRLLRTSPRNWEKLSTLAHRALENGGEVTEGTDPSQESPDALFTRPLRLHSQVNKDDILRAQQAARRNFGAREGEAAAAMYLVLEGKQRLARKEYRWARDFFQDAIFFLYPSPHVEKSSWRLELETWQEEAMRGFLAAALLYGSFGSRDETEALVLEGYRRWSRHALFAFFEAISSIVPLARMLLEIGYAATEGVIQLFLWEVLKQRPISTLDLVIELVHGLTEPHPKQSGNVLEQVGIILYATGKGLESSVPEEKELWRWFLKQAEEVHLGSDTSPARGRQLLLEASRHLETSADAFQRLEMLRDLMGKAADAIVDPSEPYFSISHRLLNGHICLKAPEPHMILEVKLAEGDVGVRDLETSATLEGDEGLVIKDAVRQPPPLPHLKPGHRYELKIPIDAKALNVSRARMLQVTHTLRPRQGKIQHLDKVSPKTFEIDVLEQLVYSSELPANPYVFGRAILRPELFFGRQQERTEIKRVLIGQTQDNVVLVVGERRIGKTSLLNALQKEPEIVDRYIPLYIDMENLQRSQVHLFFELLVSPLNRELGRRGFGKRPPVVHDEFKQAPQATFQRWMDDLDRYLAKRGKRVLLIIDEIEKLFERIGSDAHLDAELDDTVVACLRATMQRTQHISYLMSGVTGAVRRYIAGRKERFFKLAGEINLKPLEVSAARRLTRDPVDHLYEVTSAAVDLLSRETARQPYLLQRVGHALFEHMMEQQLQVATTTHVEEVFDKRVLPDPRHFSYLTEELKDESDFQVVCGLAALQRGNVYVSVSELLLWCHRQALKIDRVELHNRLERLTREAALVVEKKVASQDRFRLSVGLYARHLRRKNLGRRIPAVL